jgi:CheY-like chemotaxis protein
MGLQLRSPIFIPGRRVRSGSSAAQFKPEVVLLDIGMPRMNEYEAAKEIRERAKGESRTQ